MLDLFILNEIQFVNVNSTHGSDFYVTAPQSCQANTQFGKQARKMKDHK